MDKKKSILIIYFLMIFSFSALTQEQGLKTIVQEDLKRHLSFVASDSLQGRMIGTEFPGLEVTAGYLKKEIEKMGLKPGLPGYSQKVEILKKELELDSIYIQINNENGNRVYRSGEIICLDKPLESVKLKGEVVFTGFGWNDLESDYNDFAGIDLKDKIVFIAEGNPEIYNRENKPADRKLEENKKERAFGLGAKAVIVISLSQKKGNNSLSKLLRLSNQKGYELYVPGDNEKQFYFLATLELADKILGGSKKYKKYLSKIVKKKNPQSFLVEGNEIEISYQVKNELFHSENVIGYIEGSDSILKNECVVYIAHHDHLGVTEDGDVYNGADDNGSGIVTLLELAEAFSSLETKPKRSIVFLWVTAEELGMFGSGFYAQHPVFPMEKTAICINLDMVGRVYEPRDSVWNKSPKLVKDFDGVFTLTNNVWSELQQISDSVCSELGLVPDNTLSSSFLRSSDHYNFHKNGVPILNVANGYHADYHKSTDEISRINFDKMKRVADFCFLVGMEVANKEKIIKSVNVK